MSFALLKEKRPPEAKENGLPRQCVPQGYLLRGARWAASQREAGTGDKRSGGSLWLFQRHDDTDGDQHRADDAHDGDLLVQH